MLMIFCFLIDRDMASTLLFCATNTYLNGQTITVDGGYTLAAGM